MQASNVKAMRKALESALAVLDGFGYARPDCVRAAYDCKTALAAPPRQCDIGTAEEQRRRYDEWRNHDGLRAALGKDEFEWAQMPY